MPLDLHRGGEASLRRREVETIANSPGWWVPAPLLIDAEAVVPVAVVTDGHRRRIAFAACPVARSSVRPWLVSEPVATVTAQAWEAWHGLRNRDWAATLSR